MCVSVAMIAIAAAACSTVKTERVATEMKSLPRQAGDAPVPLGAGIQISSSRKDPATVAATLPFQLQTVPNPARIEMLVTGVSSACPLTTQPQGATELIINGKRVSSVTLGPSGVGYSHRISADLEPAILRPGENTLVLKGTPCALGNFEVVRINDIVVGAKGQ
jgi:hypothetical protein